MAYLSRTIWKLRQRPIRQRLFHRAQFDVLILYIKQNQSYMLYDEHLIDVYRHICNVLGCMYVYTVSIVLLCLVSRKVSNYDTESCFLWIWTIMWLIHFYSLIEAYAYAIISSSFRGRKVSNGEEKILKAILVLEDISRQWTI